MALLLPRMPHPFAVVAEDYQALMQLKQLEARRDLALPSVRALGERDREDDTLYCLTLYTYLSCHHSLQETCARLYTHRNTVLYRVKRMREDFDIPIDDPDKHLALLLSAALMLLEQGREDVFIPGEGCGGYGGMRPTPNGEWGWGVKPGNSSIFSPPTFLLIAGWGQTGPTTPSSAGILYPTTFEFEDSGMLQQGVLLCGAVVFPRARASFPTVLVVRFPGPGHAPQIAPAEVGLSFMSMYPLSPAPRSGTLRLETTSRLNLRDAAFFRVRAEQFSMLS